MVKRNCWEVLRCGREKGGVKSAALGVCPAANNSSAHGINGGISGGRICWAITGTFCGGEVTGSCAENQVSCLYCDFFQMVKEEESVDFYLLRPGQTYRAVKR